MGSERNILKRLLEGVEPEYVKDEDLEEASFEAQGKIFKSAFGHYSCDGEPISREDYMKAREIVNGNPRGNASSTPRQPKAPTKKAPKANANAGLFKGAGVQDTYLGKPASAFGDDDSKWDDDDYEILATYNGAAKGLGANVDDVASVNEENPLYKHMNYIAQQGGWKKEKVNHPYSNINTTKFTNPKTGESFTSSNNGMGYQTFEVDTKKAFDPKSYTKDVDPDDLEDYMY